MTARPTPPDTSWARQPAAVRARELLLVGAIRPLLAVVNRPVGAGFGVLDDLEPPVVFAANHASHLDTPLILLALPRRWRRRTSAVAAMDYFFANRVLGSFVSLLFAAVPVERAGVSMTTLRRLDALIAEGWSVLIFPEGTRTATGAVGPLQSGTARIAIRWGRPIVPVHVAGTFESWPKGRRWPRRHPVTVRCGSPLGVPHDRDHRALAAALSAALDGLAAGSGERARGGQDPAEGR